MTPHLGSAAGRALKRALTAALLLPSMAGIGAAAPAATAVAGHMTPAIGAHPVLRQAARASGTTFTCQAPTASPRCYTPGQIAQGYGISAFKNRGAGETVVIIDAFQSPTLASDVQLEDSLFGLPAPKLSVIAPQGLTPWNGSDPNQVGWSAEISLDVEAVHADAPQARIDLVLAKDNQDLSILEATAYAVNHNLGDVYSQSFGEAEQCLLPKLRKWEHQLYAEAVSMGATLFASSGDNGAAQPTCDGSSLVLSASTPASDPLVTGVGGTNLFLSTKNQWVGEVAWQDGYGESGGGISSLFPAPKYQMPLGAPSRLVPDVAFNAGVNGGILIAWGDSSAGPGAVYIFGGTSAGSPAWAAMTAVADQMAGHRLGNINPRLYQLALGSGYTSYFHDITIGNNATTVGGYSTAPGFDLVTGWGSPQAQNLLPALAS